MIGSVYGEVEKVNINSEAEKDTIVQNEWSYYLSIIVNFMISNILNKKSKNKTHIKALRYKLKKMLKAFFIKNYEYQNYVELFVRKVDLRYFNSKYYITFDIGIAKLVKLDLIHAISKVGLAALPAVTRFLNIINGFTKKDSFQPAVIKKKIVVKDVSYNNLKKESKATFFKERIILTDQDLNRLWEDIKSSNKQDQATKINEIEKTIDKITSLIIKLKETQNTKKESVIKREIDKLQDDVCKKQNEIKNLQDSITEYVDLQFYNGNVSIVVLDKHDLSKEKLKTCVSKIGIHFKKEEVIVFSAETDDGDVIQMEISFLKCNNKSRAKISLVGVAQKNNIIKVLKCVMGNSSYIQ